MSDTGFAEYLILECDLKKRTAERTIKNIKRIRLITGPDINESSVRKLVKTLRGEGYAPSYINNLINSLNHYWSYLGNKEGFNKYRLKVPRKINPVLTTEEVEAIIETRPHRSRDNKYYVDIDKCYDILFEFLATSGCRINEALQIKIEDIDFSREVFILNETKTDEPRVVPLSPSMAETIQNWIDQRSACPSDFLFASQDKINGQEGKPLSRRIVAKTLKNRAEAAGITKTVHPHMFRRYLMTELANQNVSVFKIQKIVGHKNLSSTMFYVNLATEYLKDAIYSHPLVQTSVEANYVINQFKRLVKKFIDSEAEITVTESKGKLHIDIT